MKYLVQHNDGAEVIEAAGFRIDCEGVLLIEQRSAEGDEWERENSHAFAVDYWQHIRPVPIEDVPVEKEDTSKFDWDRIKADIQAEAQSMSSLRAVGGDDSQTTWAWNA